MIEWPDALVDVIARRRCVVMVGSGVSRNSTNNAGRRPPTWEEFLLSCSEQLGNPPVLTDLIRTRDFLSACEIIKRRMQVHAFVHKVQHEFQRPAYNFAEIHKNIYNLDVSIVASPNFDNIYETYASNISAGSVVVKDHTSGDIANYLLGGDTRLILKTHGSANTPQDVIFTRFDYAQARTKFTLFYEILKSLVLTHSFLFLGCGIDDPDIRTLFEDVQFAHARMPFHYMTVATDSVNEDVLEMTSDLMHVKFLKYSPEKNHEQLTSLLAKLVELVEERRTGIAPSRAW